MMTNYFSIVLFSLSLFISLPASAATYEEGRAAYLDKDYEKALQILKPLAEKGHAKAQVTLGIMYDFGHGVEKDTARAVEWYEKAAAQGNSVVQHDLGVKYFRGDGIPQNYEKAAAWWRMAADNGVAESQYNLGLMYQRGLGFEKDSAQAVIWYAKAASQGHAYAQYSLGVMYSFGQGVQQDYSKALTYFQDAAEQDIAQAQYNLAVLLENGRGTDVDLPSARKWYKKAADAGIEQATQRLASLEKTDQSSSAHSQQAGAEQPTDHDLEQAGIADTTNQVDMAKSETPEAGASTKPADLVDPAEIEPLPAPKEQHLPEEMDDSTQVAVTIPEKQPPANHQVIHGDVIETAKETVPEKTTITEKKVVKERDTVLSETTSPDDQHTASVGGSTQNNETWIKTQDPAHYALQMIAFREEENAIRFMQNLDLQGDRAVYKSTMHGRPIYKVIYGNFESHRASLKGRRALPQKYKTMNPFPRSFEFIQNDIRE